MRDLGKNKHRTLNLESFVTLGLIAVVILTFAVPALAQGGLEGRINETIGDLVRLINLVIVGFIAWSGFLIAKGDGTGINRLIYGVVGLVVVNSAYLIISYFS